VLVCLSPNRCAWRPVSLPDQTSFCRMLGTCHIRADPRTADRRGNAASPAHLKQGERFPRARLEVACLLHLVPPGQDGGDELGIGMASAMKIADNGLNVVRHVTVRYS
jgi:hypothetical protein